MVNKELNFLQVQDFLLGAGVEFFVDEPKAVAVDVGINLGGGDIDVAEHLLDASQVGATCQKMRGETVAKGLGGEVAAEACAGGVFFYKAPDFDAAEGSACAGEE